MTGASTARLRCSDPTSVYGQCASVCEICAAMHARMRKCERERERVCARVRLREGVRTRADAFSNAVSVCVCVCVQWGMSFSQYLSFCRLTRTCRYFTFVAHNAPGPITFKGRCRARKSCSDCLLYRTCPKSSPYNCRGCSPKTHVLVNQRFLPAFQRPTFSSHSKVEPLYRGQYCGGVHMLNPTSRWGLKREDCQNRCEMNPRCTHFTSVPHNAPGPGGVDCILYPKCPFPSGYALARMHGTSAHARKYIYCAFDCQNLTLPSSGTTAISAMHPRSCFPRVSSSRLHVLAGRTPAPNV